MLIVAIIAGLVWAASAAGTGTKGLDVVVSLILLGLVAFDPIVPGLQPVRQLWTRAPGSRSRAGSWRPAARGRRAASRCRTRRRLRPSVVSGRLFGAARFTKND